MAKTTRKRPAAAAAARPAPLAWPDVLAWLIEDGSAKAKGDVAEVFLRESWEKAPSLRRATEKRRSCLEGICGRRHFGEMMRKLEDDEIALVWAEDVNAVRYTRKKGRETLNPAPARGETKALARSNAVWKMFDQKGCSLQLHQPQRFCDQLNRLLFELESYFGCLVGCNAYMTPKGSQGLAPHFDDVEIFVVQTEGTKRWRIYRPPAGWELADKHSRDYTREELGKPVMEVVLHPGDVLYMPRGTPHEACCSEGVESFHVTISTYQGWSLADLAGGAMQVALRGAFSGALRLPPALRTSLPAGAAFALGSAGASSRATLANDLAEGLERWAALLRSESGAASKRARRKESRSEDDGAGSGLLARGVDFMAADFMRARLPPPEDLLPPVGACPRNPADVVRARLPRVVRVQLVSNDWDEEIVQVQHCLRNSREHHMVAPGDDGSDEDEEDEEEDAGVGAAASAEASASQGADAQAADATLAFPVAALPALQRLFVDEAADLGVSISELPGLPSRDALGLAQQLWEEGLLVCDAKGAAAGVLRKRAASADAGAKKRRKTSRAQ